MITSYFAADEPRPFPEEWYQHGYIENNDQPGSASHMYDEGSYARAPADDTWVPRWEDDRMGMMEHPHRGKQNYMSLFYIVVNVVHHAFTVTLQSRRCGVDRGYIAALQIT